MIKYYDDVDKKRSKPLLRLSQFPLSFHFLRTQIIVQPLGLRNSIRKLLYFPHFDLKAVLPAAKAINLNPIFDRLLAFGTDHLLGGLLKA